MVDKKKDLHEDDEDFEVVELTEDDQDDDGELRARPVLAGGRTARDRGPSDAQRGDSGRVRAVSYADGRAHSTRGRREGGRVPTPARDAQPWRPGAPAGSRRGVVFGMPPDCEGASR